MEIKKKKSRFLIETLTLAEQNNGKLLHRLASFIKLIFNDFGPKYKYHNDI